MKTLQARVWTFPLFFLVAAGCAEGGSADDVVVSEGAPNMFPQGTPLDVSPPALGTRMREHAILPPSVSRPMFVAARLRGRPSYDLYTMWDDGSGLRHLTNTPNVDELVPSVSPDGHHLATTLRVCARSSCEPLIRSVVLSSLDALDQVPVFVAEGGEAVFRPEP